MEASRSGRPVIGRDSGSISVSANWAGVEDMQSPSFPREHVLARTAKSAKKHEIRFSENHNDNETNRRIANRLYEKYSASQDYYYSTMVNNILSEAQTAGAVHYFDVLTLLDTDEYLKRYYAWEEYDGKIRLLSEYYKFHKDIPRIFSLPEFITLNKFYDSKRKFEYQRIRKLLAEEAAKKNKRVAMNEDDNEIRLTDGDIEEERDPPRRKDYDQQDGEEESELEDDSSVEVDRSRESRVLPTGLIHSLYKHDSKFGKFNRKDQPKTYRYYMKEESHSTIQALHDALKREANGESFISDWSISQKEVIEEVSPFKVNAIGISAAPRALNIQSNRTLERPDLIASNSSLRGALRETTTDSRFSGDTKVNNQLISHALIGKTKSHRVALTDRGQLANQVGFHEEYLGIGGQLGTTERVNALGSHRSQTSLKPKSGSKVVLGGPFKPSSKEPHELGTVGRLGTSAGKAKELQLNINLNLRVMREDPGANSARGEYVCFAPGAKSANARRKVGQKKSDLMQNELLKDINPERLVTRESVLTRDSHNPQFAGDIIRVSNKKLKGFGKKTKPEEVRPNSKDTSKGFSSKDRRQDSHDSNQKTDTKAHPFALQIHNLRRALPQVSGIEFQKMVEEKPSKVFKSKNIDKRVPRSQLEPFSPGKDKSLAKGTSKPRTGLQHEFPRGIAQAPFGGSSSTIQSHSGGKLTGNLHFTQSTGSIHQVVKSNSKKAMRPSSNSKRQAGLNFKQKKLSLQQGGQPYGVFPGTLGSYYAGAGDMWFGAPPLQSKQAAGRDSSNLKRLKNSVGGQAKLKPNSSSGNLECWTDRQHKRERTGDSKELVQYINERLNAQSGGGTSQLQQRPVYQNQEALWPAKGGIKGSLVVASQASTSGQLLHSENPSLEAPAHVFNLQASALSRVLQNQPKGHALLTQITDPKSARLGYDDCAPAESRPNLRDFATDEKLKFAKDKSLTPPLGLQKLSLSNSFGNYHVSVTKPLLHGQLPTSSRTLLHGIHGKSHPAGLSLDQDSKESMPKPKSTKQSRKDLRGASSARSRSTKQGTGLLVSSPQILMNPSLQSGSRPNLIQGSKFTRVVTGEMTKRINGLASKANLEDLKLNIKKGSPYPRHKTKESYGQSVGLFQHSAKSLTENTERRGVQGQATQQGSLSGLQNNSKSKANIGSTISTSHLTIGVPVGPSHSHLGSNPAGSVEKNPLMIAHSYSKSETRPGLFQLGYPGVSSVANKQVIPGVGFSGPDIPAAGSILNPASSTRKKTHSSSLSTNLRNTSGGALVTAHPTASQLLTTRKDK